MYILSGTHMHVPENRMAVYPIVMRRSLYIIYYVHSGLYNIIYSISADIFMQNEPKKHHKRIATHKLIKSLTHILESPQKRSNFIDNVFVSWNICFCSSVSLKAAVSVPIEVVAKW